MLAETAPLAARSSFQRQLLATRTVSEAAYIASDYARQVLRSDLAWVGIREDDIMYMAGSSGLQTAEMMSAWKLELGLGIGGLAIEHGRALADKNYNYRDDPSKGLPKRARLINLEGVVGVAAAPLLASDETLGVLYVGQREIREFTTEELNELEFIADCLTTTAAKLIVAEKDRETITRLTQELEGFESIVQQTRVLLETATHTEDVERVMEVVAYHLQVKLDLQDDAGHVLRSVSGVAADTTPWELWAVETSPLQSGRLIFYGRRKLNRAETTLAKASANVVDLQLMRKSAQLQAELRISNRVFERLLEADFDERSIMTDAALLGAQIDGSLRALVLRPAPRRGESASAISRSEVESALAAIKRFYPTALGLPFGGDVIAILPSDDLATDEVIDCVGDELLPSLRPAQLRAVLGPKVENLAEVSDSYYRALLTLDLSVPGDSELPSVSLYDQTFDAFPADATRETILRHVRSVLGDLLERDEQAGGDYLRTLAAYFANDRHLKHTAERLHVHLNTVRYRIERIEEILGVSFRDADQRFRIEWAVRLYDRLGSNP